MAKHAPSAIDFVSTTHHDTYDYIKPEQFDLSGKAVFITGASRGIGKACAISFAKAGASYIGIAARGPLEDVVKEIRGAAAQAGRDEPRILALKVDVENNDNVEAAAKEVDNAFSRLDVLVNNAGHLERLTPIADSGPDEWKRVWSVNVFGVYHVTRAFIPLLRKAENGQGQILMVSSIGALVSSPGGSAYQSGKTALLRLAEFVNVEEPALLTYCIHPGGVHTELSSMLPDDMRSKLGDTPQLAGDSVVWLLSQHRGWLRDRYVSVNWDMEELLQKRQDIEHKGLLKLRLVLD